MITLTEDFDEDIERDDELKAQIDDLVETYNQYMDIKMRVIETNREFYELHIGVDLITEGDTSDIFDRVKGILRENDLLNI